ncbi:hypothetical protein [Paenibacillus sp. NPDC057967]|uniref:hypothetical protein n=1 Tax=Paenibacillus sp. NPDC057967 TaxID=3346293 RepID=UPI0036DA0688
MKPITIKHGPYEDDDGYDYEPGFLVADGYAMYYNAHYGQMWLDVVTPVSDRPGTYLSDIGIVLTEQTDDIAGVYRLLTGMNAFDFVLKHLMHCPDLEIFPDGPPKLPPDEPIKGET